MLMNVVDQNQTIIKLQSNYNPLYQYLFIFLVFDSYFNGSYALDAVIKIILIIFAIK